MTTVSKPSLMLFGKVKMIDLEDRPLTLFQSGDTIKLIDIRGTSGWKKRTYNLAVGNLYTVEKCWKKKRAGTDRYRILCTIEGVKGVFSTRRFEQVSFLPEDLFTI